VDFWDGFFDLLADLFGEIGLLWVSFSVIVMIFVGYFVWWEWIK
jgi:hypothetical protein